MEFGFQEGAFTPVLDVGSRADETYEGVDVVEEDATQMVADVASAMYSKGFATAGGQLGTRDNVEGDCLGLLHFAIARRAIAALRRTEGRETRLTNLVLRMNLQIPGTIAKAVNSIGEVETMSRLFKPRDLETLAIKNLFYACHYAHIDRTRGYSDDINGNIQDVEWSYLTYNRAGDIMERREQDLRFKIAALAREVLNQADDSKFVVAQRILEVSSDQHLAKVERLVVSEGILTQNQINALYPQQAPHNNNNHRNAVREVTGDATFGGGNGDVVAIGSLRSRLGNLQLIGQKLKRDYSQVFTFQDIGNDKGDTPLLVGYREIVSIVDSVVPMSIRDIGSALVSYWAVGSFGRHYKRDDYARTTVRATIIDKDVI